MPKSKSAPLLVESVSEVARSVGHTSEVVVQSEVPPAQVQGNYQPASVTISAGSGHVINLGQESPSMPSPTLPQKLTSHPIGYWLVHLLIAFLGAAAFEGFLRLLK